LNSLTLSVCPSVSVPYFFAIFQPTILQNYQSVLSVSQICSWVWNVKRTNKLVIKMSDFISSFHQCNIFVDAMYLHLYMLFFLLLCYFYSLHSKFILFYETIFYFIYLWNEPTCSYYTVGIIKQISITYFCIFFACTVRRH
jgi:hypothetical protein